MVYKEFLKVLYEDDINENRLQNNFQNSKDKIVSKKLSCAEACDKIEEVNKHTIRLWDVLLYWRKKRHVCYTKPFLELDLNLTLKSIAKVNKYLD